MREACPRNEPATCDILIAVASQALRTRARIQGRTRTTLSLDIGRRKPDSELTITAGAVYAVNQAAWMRVKRLGCTQYTRKSG